MSHSIELTPDRTKMLLVLHREGKAPHRDRFDPVQAGARRKQAEACGVDSDTFADWCEQARVRGGAMEFTPRAATRAPVGHVTIRSLEASAGTREDAGSADGFLATRLTGLPQDWVAEWDGLEALCCLDIDYHDQTVPSREWLTAQVMTRVSPKPAAWHFSKGGGLHLFYLAAGAFTADELAACAALRFRSLDASAGLELKRVVRGPGQEAVHVSPSGQDTTGTFLQWLESGDSSEEDRDTWLESEGMACGQRYTHERCPIDPGPSSKGDSPVTVSEQGIYCFRCNGKGLTLGSRRAGFVPWPAILGAPSSGELGNMIRSLTHWGHAQYVLSERYGVPAALGRLAYKAALNAYHEGKPSVALVANVFDRRTEPLTRVNNLWMTVDDSHVYPNTIVHILSQMPAAQYVDAEGNVKSDLALVTELQQTKDLTRYGYANVSVVHGFKLTQPFLADDRQTRIAVPNPALKPFSNRCLPRYRNRSGRGPTDAAWVTLETVVPRIDRVFVRALIVAFGCAQETQRGLLPVIFAAGPSGAGKTAMCQVACGILGARVGGECTYDADPSRFRSQIFEGGQQGPVVVFNELLKDSARGRHKATAREALDFVLNLTPQSTSHKLFTGPVKMGRLPAIVITEPECPMMLQDETQLARRIRYHKIEGRKDEWKNTIAASGISDLNMIRTVSDAVAKACDCILSDTVDTFFSVPATWDEMADSLGVRAIECSDAFESQEPWLRELFRLVALAPDLDEKDARMYRGYKKITRDLVDNDLVQVYTRFADGNGSNWVSSRRLLEKDWSAILKTDAPVNLSLCGHNGDVFVRFFTGPIKKPTKTNGQIVDVSTWGGIL